MPGTRPGMTKPAGATDCTNQTKSACGSVRCDTLRLPEDREQVARLLLRRRGWRRRLLLRLLVRLRLELRGRRAPARLLLLGWTLLPGRRGWRGRLRRIGLRAHDRGLRPFAVG